jgi:hypothetical protein
MGAMLLVAFLLACAPPVPVEPRAEVVVAGGADDPLAAGDVFAAASAPPLYEQLYVGEYGAQARRLGDRVRILAWLRALAPDAAQRAALIAASRDVRARLADLEAGRGAVDEAESAALGDTYRRLAAELVKPEGPSAQEATAASAAIASARATLPDTRGAQVRATRAVLDRAGTFAEALRPEQRSAMRHALFFLRSQLGADAAPGAYEALLKASWDGAGDFGTIRRTDRGPEDPGSLDVGGIWVLEDGDVTAGVKGLRLQTLLALALAHEGLCGAVEAYAGARAPDDLSPSCAPVSNGAP